MFCSMGLTHLTNHFGVSLTSVTAFAWFLSLVWTRYWACIYIYICVSIQYVCSTYFLIYITSSLNMSSYKYTTLCISWHRYTCDNMMTVTSIRPWEFDRFFFHVRNMTTLLRSGQKQRRNTLWKNSLSWPPPLVTWLGSTFGHSVMVNTQHVTMSWMMMIPTLLQIWYKSQ